MKIYENLNISNLENEVWKFIDDFPDYQVSNLGRVKSLKFKKEKLLKQQLDNRGYFCVKLYKNKRSKSKLVHILVYETFCDYKLKSNECVHHKDENKINNYLNNYELMTKTEHSKLHIKNNDQWKVHHFGKDAPMFGKHHSDKTKRKISENNVGMKGKCHSQETKNKISKSQPNKTSNLKIFNIKYDLKNNLTFQEISKKYNVSIKTIQRIKNGKISIKLENI